MDMRVFYVAAAVVGCAAIGGANSSGGTYPGGKGLIAFMRVQDGSYEIVAIPSDGSRQTNLTQNPADDLGPTWSPDGRRIAFHSTRDGASQIYVMNADGSAVTRLTNESEGAFWASWSPDGRRLAYGASRGRNVDIYVMNVDGTGVARLTTDPALDFKPAWSPRGDRIAFLTQREGSNLQLYVMNADGTAQTNLSRSSDHHAIVAGAWSPDGERIAFDSERDGNREIYVANADGSGLVRLTNNPGADLEAAWSPDGRQLVFVRNGALHAMDAGGGTPTFIQLSTEARVPDWQPVPAADLAVTKRVRGAARKGQPVTYVVTVTNGGPAPATNVRVSDRLPRNVRLLTARATSGSCRGGSTVRCVVGVLPPATRLTVTIRARVLTTRSLLNTASAASDQPDLEPANNSATIRTRVRR